MKKILFGITGLTIGGAERVLVDLANELSKNYDITIFTLYAKGELEKELNSNVKLKSLFKYSYKEMSKLKQKIIVPLKVLLLKNSIYNKNIKGNYDVEIAFLEGPITRLFSVKNKNVRKIAWVHNDISLVFGKGLKARLKKYLDKKIYDKYNDLVFVSKENMCDFDKTYTNLNISDEHKKVIYNYIDKQRIIKKSLEDIDISFKKEDINFVTVSRLVYQKGIDRIIEIHKKLIESGYNHKFYVIGDGPEREKLENLIRGNKVENSFFLLGQKENPYPYIKNADYFCLLSRFEGYGMVLEEAKILGKPIIITDTAAREAVEDYDKKWILENSNDGIYNGLEEIIEKRNKDIDGNYNENMKEYDNAKIIEEIKGFIGE